MKKTVLCLLAAFALAAVASAADFAGKWSGAFTLGDSGDSRTAYMVLKQAGMAVTGAAGPSADEQWPIENAKVEGSKLSFDVRDPDGNVYKVALSLDGDNLNGDLTAAIGGESIKGKIRFSRVK